MEIEQEQEQEPKTEPSPPGVFKRECRDCGQSILMVRGEDGRWMALDYRDSRVRYHNCRPVGR